MNPTFKRRNYFINKELQGKYIFKAFLLVALGSILFALIFSFFSANTLSIVYDNYHLRLGTTPGILLNKILRSQWLFIVLGGIAIAVITLFLTHRVAGPFFRFEKTLDNMTAKDISVRIALRPKDEGKELASKINCFNEMLSSNLNHIGENAEQILLCCDQIDSMKDDEATLALLRAEIKKIKHCNQDTISILHAFKLIEK
jgi:methyl-accepting chemotaxis protein